MTGLFLALCFAAFAGAAMATCACAVAGQYTCQVPVAVLCQGCARDVTISLEPRGGCRVSFSPTPGVAALDVSGAVNLQIQTPAVSPSFRRRGSYRKVRAAISRQSPSQLCFVFNGSQYCE